MAEKTKKVASVILRYCNQSRSRARNLRILLHHLAKIPTLEIVVSVMDKDFTPHVEVKKIFTPGTFESSRANNIGAAAATTDILIFQDADIIFEASCYTKIIQSICAGQESVRVGEQCVNLGAVNVPKLQRNPTAFLKHRFKTCLRDAPGACIALSRSAFIKVGGHCELFKVYGWEDCYFRYKVKTLTKQSCLNQQMIHLPHEENFQMGHQADNAHLYQELLYTDGGNCIKLSERDRKFLLEQYPTLR